MWTGTTHKRDGRGYFQIDRRPVIASRVAWELSFGPIPEGLDVCHTCDRPGCCRPEHLWLGTGAENHADKARKGRAPRGERANAAKLNTAAVLKIRELYSAGGVSQQAIADTCGVSQAVISAIVRRKTWRHI
jgi:predicted XRE-type DNA-binding protein